MNQAAIGSDSGTGEKFYAAEVFAEAFDYDFVFAENFFDDQADLTIVGVGHDHPEVAIDRFERREAKIRIEADDFRHDVANFCQELATDVFNFVCTYAANFFDDCKRNCKMRLSAANEKRRGDDQRERNFQNEFGSCARGALNFDFAVEGVQIGADDVETHATAGEFCFDGGSRKAGVEQHVAKFAFGQPAGGFMGDQAAFDCALLDALVIDAATVVFDFNVDVIAAMIGAKDDTTEFRFPGFPANFGHFDAVSDRVANQVNERIGNLLNDVVVEFGFAAGEIEFDLFSGGLRRVANRA